MGSLAVVASTTGQGRPARVQVLVGAGCVVLGGAVAAVAGPLQFNRGSWLAAYLVLVCGVAQFAMGRASTLLGGRWEIAALSWALVVCWNLGNAGVIGGTLDSRPLLVDAGSLLLVVGLTLAIYLARPATHAAAGSESISRLAGWAYRGLLLVLLVSISIGVAVTHLRRGT